MEVFSRSGLYEMMAGVLIAVAVLILLGSAYGEANMIMNLLFK